MPLTPDVGGIVCPQEMQGEIVLILDMIFAAVLSQKAAAGAGLAPESVVREAVEPASGAVETQPDWWRYNGVIPGAERDLA
jgi:hypothetical protein